MPFPALSVCRTERHTNTWQIEIYYKNVFSAYWLQTSCRLLTHFCKFFLYQYLLDVATVSSSTLLKFTTHIRNNTATHVFQIQQLNKFNFHLNLLRCFSCELLLCQETPRKKSKNSGQVWEAAKICHNSDSPENGLTWRDCQNQSSRSPALPLQYRAWHHLA